MSQFLYKNYLVYLIRFLGAFCLLFYSTEAVIGLSSPENSYNAFVANYLNYIDPARYFLLVSSKALLSQFQFDTYLSDKYTLKAVGGGGIRMVYSCIGYGVIAFWLAFNFANSGRFWKKAAWMVGGTMLLCGINIIRVSLLVVATNKGWPIPFGWDHHTWFNIVSYLLIFYMIYAFDRQQKCLSRKEKPLVNIG